MKKDSNQALEVDPHCHWPLIVLIVVALIVVLVTGSVFTFNQLVRLVAVAVPTGLLAWHLREDRRRQHDCAAMLSHLPIPFALASAPGFSQHYAKLADALSRIVKHQDSLFRGLALARLEEIADELVTIAQGQIVFTATETWRTAYQHILETLHLKTYYSVAWVRTNEYWNDAPGKQSMRLNYELVERGFRIERCHILPDEIWPFDQKLPTTGILEWLVEQQGRGIVVSLIRESDLSKEPDLLRDFAVYGDRAIGIQEMDEQAHTVRFILSFDQPSIRQALDRWERLSLYKTSFADFVDHLQP